MWVSQVIVLFLAITKGFAYNNQVAYKLKLEKVTRTYLDTWFAENEVHINKYNDTVNLMTTAVLFKFDVDENVLIDVHCYRLTKSNRKFSIIRFTKGYKDLVEMETFGMNAFYLEYTRPQLVWPPKKNVRYETKDWAPGMAFYPPNIPAGKIEVESHYMFKNGTKFITNEYIINVAY